MVRNKQTQVKLAFSPILSSLFPKFSFTPSFPAVLPLVHTCSSTEGWALGGCGQYSTAPLCHSFHLTLFPCSSISLLSRLQSFRINLLQCGPSTGHSSFRECYLFLSWSRPQAAGNTYSIDILSMDGRVITTTPGAPPLFLLL